VTREDTKVAKGENTEAEKKRGKGEKTGRYTKITRAKEKLYQEGGRKGKKGENKGRERSKNTKTE